MTGPPLPQHGRRDVERVVQLLRLPEDHPGRQRALGMLRASLDARHGPARGWVLWMAGHEIYSAGLGRTGPVAYPAPTHTGTDKYVITPQTDSGTR